MRLVLLFLLLQLALGLDYEIWAADQSNSAPNQTAFGVKGGFVYIWDSKDLEQQISGGSHATPKPCGPGAPAGPCDLLDVFPQALEEVRQDGTLTGNTLETSGGFGRFHGALGDPTGRYVNVNMFAPGGGYIGVMDTSTKEAVGLFRVTEFSFGSGGSTATSRSVHMSVWSQDGSAILITNLNGKAIERINVERDSNGTITDLLFDTSATLGLGQAQSVTSEATVFRGPNQHGNNLLGRIVGSYASAGLGNLTPTGACKENGCVGGSTGLAGGRGNNVPICALPSANDNVYITLGGGGLLVADLKTTPMSIVGEYGNAIVYGAGCGGVQAKGKMYLNAGVSAAGAGATQSLFALFSFQDDAFPVAGAPSQNAPMPVRVFQDKGNTRSIGNAESAIVSDSSGQLPGVSTRRDSHGAATHPSGKYVYVLDRIASVMEVFHVDTNARSTFDLASATGQGGREGATGPCYTTSVLDDPNLPLNDPTSDLIHITPDGKYLFLALRGPAPVSVGHSGQGSCPGVGVVELLNGGSTGRLLTVLPASNQAPDLVAITAASFPGGVAYSGSERADVHSVFVVHAPFTYVPPEEESDEGTPDPSLSPATSSRRISFWTTLAGLACLVVFFY